MVLSFPACIQQVFTVNLLHLGGILKNNEDETPAFDEFKSISLEDKDIV